MLKHQSSIQTRTGQRHTIRNNWHHGCIKAAFIIQKLLYEVVCVTIGKPAIFLELYLTDVHFRGELQHVGHVGEQKIKCRPIRTREIAGVRL